MQGWFGISKSSSNQVLILVLGVVAIVIAVWTLFANALYGVLMLVAFAALFARQALLFNKLNEQHERSGKAIEVLYSELVETRDAALESARLKSEFLANMSHEIRTPMNAVIGCADMLRRTKVTPEQKKFVELIIASGNALTDVIDDILILSKIEVGKLELDKVDLNLLELTESAGQLLAEKARGKKLSLTTYVAPEVDALVIGDPQRLRQVLLNLIGNAVKFTEHGQVALRAECESKDDERIVVRFTISDTGIGIKKEVIEKLFEPFSQGDGSINREFGGTGLGLAISRRLVRLMGGDITIESTAGQGATFTVTVPFERVGAVDGSRKHQMEGVSLLVVAVPGNEFEILKSYCDSWRVQADYAPDAQVAMYFLDAAAKNGRQYDVVICDRSMSGMDPYSFFESVKNGNRDKKIAFAMVTELNDLGEYEKALLKGFGAVLTKPLRQSELFDCIASLTSQPRIALKASPSAVLRMDGFSSSLPDIFSKEILVVEDNSINQEVIRMQLSELGFVPHIVSNGREAVDLLSEHRFGLILMDCQMPVMDGFTATKEIRRLERSTGYHTPIVAMTANSMEGDRDDCLRTGMDDYLGKPVVADRLKEIIERWFLVALESDDATESVPVPDDAASSAMEISQPVARSWLMLEASFGAETADRFLEMFVEQTPALIKKVGQNIKDGNFAKLQLTAHELKGSCYAVHCLALADCSRLIEEAAREGNADALQEHYDELREQFSQLTSQWNDRAIGRDPRNIGSVSADIRVFIVEDNELTRLGIKKIFEKASDVGLAGEASDGADALEALVNARPDVALVDIGLPSMNGIELTRRIKMIDPNIKVLILTAHDSDEDMFNAFEAGADGYVVKHSFHHTRLLLALRTVASGCCWLDPFIAQRVLTVAALTNRSGTQRDQSMDIAPLSASEENLLRQVVDGDQECSEGVCRVDPTFLSRLHRFGNPKQSVR